MNVVFDFGAVLFRWAPHEFMPRLLPRRARDETSTLAIVNGFFEGYGGDWDRFDRGAIGAPELARRVALRTGLELADVLRVIAAMPAELEPIAPTLALMARLRACGHRLFFLSNMPAPFANHIEAAYPLRDWFDDGMFSSRVKLAKPDPAIFRAAAERFGIEPRESTLIDDFRANVVAARALGWDAVHFLSHAQCEADLLGKGLIQV